MISSRFLLAAEVLSIVTFAFFGPNPALWPVVLLLGVFVHFFVLGKLFGLYRPRTRAFLVAIEMIGAVGWNDQFVLYILASIVCALLLSYFVFHLAEGSIRDQRFSVLPYFKLVSAISALTIIFGVVIHSLFPRGYLAQQRSNQDLRVIGLTNELSLSHWGQLSDEGSREVAMRIHLDDRALSRFDEVFPHFLVRFQILDEFDGQGWKALEREREWDAYQVPIYDEPPLVVQVERRAVGSNRAPTFYLPFSIQPGSGDQVEVSQRGEYRVTRSERRTLMAQYQLYPEATHYFGAYIPDSTGPTDAHLEIPENFQDPRWRELAIEVFEGLEYPSDMARRLNEYFRENNFRPISPNNIRSASMSSTTKDWSDGKEIMDFFLFEEKLGHCELFATSSIILFRMMGIPARMVAGYQISRGPVGRVVQIFHGDAHAWMEFYDPENGWIPYDPTPKVYFQAPFWQTWQETWSAWAGSFQFQSMLIWGLMNDLRQRFALQLLTFVILLSVYLLWVWFRKRRDSSRRINGFEPYSSPKNLLKIRARAMKRLKSHPEAQKKWLEAYESIRFGRPESRTEDSIRQLKRQVKSSPEAAS